MASSNRITGLATGMDIDSIVEATMETYKLKVNKKKQEKDVLEIKQQLYRDLISDGQKFYNKYFDLAKSDSLLSSKNYVSTTFTSKDEAVATATGLSTAIKDNYTINVTQKAESAKKTYLGSELSGDLEIKCGNQSVLIKASEIDVKTEAEKAKIINSKISSIGMKASVSDFINGITIETTATGAAASFTITRGGTISDETVNGSTTLETEKTYSVLDLESNTNDLMFESADGKKAIIKASELTSSVKSLNEKIDKLKEDLNNGTNTDSDKEAIQEQIDELIEEKSRVLNSTITSKLSSIGIEAELSSDNSKIVIKATDSSSFKITEGTYEASKINGGTGETISGKNLHATISNSNGDKIVYDDTNIAANNSVTLDGVMFNIAGVGETTVIGKTDGTALKDKIVSFINDYNDLIKQLNKFTTENKNRDYAPLTEDQKEELSESEIEKWNEKVKQGQLKGDSDLTRILSNLKASMYSVAGCPSLASIGITMTSEYASAEAGTFKVDEEALLAAIEKDPESIMNLFTQKGDKPSNTGILFRMKDVLYDEFVSTTKSALINKAGIEGTTSFNQSTLSKQIKEYSKKISQMEDDLKDKEQKLYSKWASVETAMNTLNSQLANLQSYFG